MRFNKAMSEKNLKGWKELYGSTAKDAKNKMEKEKEDVSKLGEIEILK